jgi:hypothetical protein
MDYQALKTLLDSDGSTAAMTSQEAADWCNAEVISVDQDVVSSGQLFAAIANNKSEWDALAATERDFVKDILYIHSGEGVPTSPGSPARTQLVAILGTNTKAEIAGIISEDISRAENAGVLGHVSAGAVEYARTL